jgi:general secretion pathway protein G
MAESSKVSSAGVLSYARPVARKAKGRFPILTVAVFVCIVIGVFVVILPALGPLPQHSSRNSASLAMESYATAIMAFRNDTGRLPTNSEGISVLLSNPTHIPGWAGPYLDGSRVGPIDPWGHRYVYQANFNGTGFVIVSLGPDGQLGTPDDLIDRINLVPRPIKTPKPGSATAAPSPATR